MATDYDCWHEEEENVTADMIIKILLENAEKAKKIIKESASKIDFTKNGLCSCDSSLRQAVVTAKKDVPEETLKKLSIFNLYD
jgi:5'-methylthioadenosine phosphorylase